MSLFRRTTLLRIVVGLLLTFTLFATAFAVGEAMSDPGGWAGVGLAVSWVVPMLGMMALAWFRPALAQKVVLFLSAAMAVGLFISALSGRAWWRFENHHGPIRAIVLLVLGGILGVLALHRAQVSGQILSSLATVMNISVAIGSRSEPLFVVALPLLIAGLLIWSSAPKESSSSGVGRHV